MKKIISLNVLLLGVLVLAGCGQQQASQTQPTAPTPITQQPSQSAANQQSQENIATQSLTPNTIILEINDKFLKNIKTPNSSFMLDEGDALTWIKDDNRVACLNNDSQSIGISNANGTNVKGVSNNAKVSLDSQISSYLKNLGFTENAKNTKASKRGVGRIAFEKEGLKCLINHPFSSDATKKANMYRYNVVCADNTPQDEEDFNSLYPAMSQKLEFNKYPGGFFCVGKSEIGFATGGTSTLDMTEGLAMGGAAWYAKQTNGKWDVFVTQDAASCSFVENFPKSFGISECFTQDGKLKKL